jgi:hypothetical protein
MLGNSRQARLRSWPAAADAMLCTQQHSDTPIYTLVLSWQFVYQKSRQARLRSWPAAADAMLCTQQHRDTLLYALVILGCLFQHPALRDKVTRQSQRQQDVATVPPAQTVSHMQSSAAAGVPPPASPAAQAHTCCRRKTKPKTTRRNYLFRSSAARGRWR